MFEALNLQREQRGLFIKAGMMIGATLAEAGITDRIMHRRHANKGQPTLRRLLPASLAEVGSSV